MEEGGRPEGLAHRHQEQRLALVIELIVLLLVLLVAGLVGCELFGC